MTADPTRRLRRRPRKQIRGSALITVILVVLILTVVGIGIAYFTQVEDRVSGNDRLAKTGFYAAETGLRTGENALQAYTGAGNTVNSLLETAPSGTFLPPATPSGYFNPPGGGSRARVFRIGGVTYLNRDIPRLAAPADSSSPYHLGSRYSLFIRNNVEDPGKIVGGVLVPEQDSDSKVNLIAVGSVALPGGNAVTRVLEEQLEVFSETVPFCGQADCNQGGGGSIAK